jgi:hypothetical protein
MGTVTNMTGRVHLSVDGRGRISVQKLGFEPSSVLVAERNEDGSVVLRLGKVLTEAEIDFLSSPKSRRSLERGVNDLKNKRIDPARRGR